MENENGFKEWKNHILAELDRLAGSTEGFHNLVYKHMEENSRAHEKLLGHIKNQETKVKIWSSLVALLVASLVTMGFRYLQ